MSVKTKEQLKQDFSDNQTATGAKFADLIDSLKAVQSVVSDPAAAGTSVTFIATIKQDADGQITVTKKTVNFQGYQTVAGMSNYQTVAGMSAYQTVAAMGDYQQMDVQKVNEVTVVAGGAQTINHNMNHYPTVRLIDENGVEIDTREYTVTHVDNMSLKLELGGSLTGRYRYILN